MKILVFLPRQLGSSLLSLPALRALRMNFPTSEITLVGNESFAGVLARLLPDYSFLSLAEIKDIKKLKSASQVMARQRFDLAVLLDDSFASALVAYLARIPERWGYDRENRGFMLTRKIRLKYTDPPLHLMDYYLNLLKTVLQMLKYAARRFRLLMFFSSLHPAHPAPTKTVPMTTAVSEPFLLKKCLKRWWSSASSKPKRARLPLVDR